MHRHLTMVAKIRIFVTEHVDLDLYLGGAWFEITASVV
jgi:hypothetical protein